MFFDKLFTSYSPHIAQAIRFCQRHWMMMTVRVGHDIRKVRFYGLCWLEKRYVWGEMKAAHTGAQQRKKGT